MWKVKLNIRALGGNQMKGIEWWRYKKHKDNIRLLLREELKHLPSPPISKRHRVEYHRIGKRFMDADNLAAGAKPFLDVLQEEHMLYDDPFSPKARPIISGDSPKEIEAVFSQSVGAGYAVVISLTAL